MGPIMTAPAKPLRVMPQMVAMDDIINGELLDAAMKARKEG